MVDAHCTLIEKVLLCVPLRYSRVTIILVLVFLLFSVFIYAIAYSLGVRPALRSGRTSSTCRRNNNNILGEGPADIAQRCRNARVLLFFFENPIYRPVLYSKNLQYIRKRLPARTHRTVKDFRQVDRCVRKKYVISLLGNGRAYFAQHFLAFPLLFLLAVHGRILYHLPPIDNALLLCCVGTYVWIYAKDRVL